MHRRRMVQRHADERVVVGREIERNDRRRVLEHKSTMSHHGALGLRRSSRGIEQLHEIGVGHVGIDSENVTGRGNCEQRIVGVAQSKDDVGRHVRAHPVDVLAQCRIDENCPRTRLPEQVDQLVAAERVVDRHVHEPARATAR